MRLTSRYKRVVVGSIPTAMETLHSSVVEHLTVSPVFSALHKRISLTKQITQTIAQQVERYFGYTPYGSGRFNSG